MKRPAAIAIAVACVAAVVLCGVRVAQVNSAYPEQNAYAYSLGEEATYSGQDSSGGVVERGSVTVRAENTELLDYEGLEVVGARLCRLACRRRYVSGHAGLFSRGGDIERLVRGQEGFT